MSNEDCPRGYNGKFIAKFKIAKLKKKSWSHNVMMIDWCYFNMIIQLEYSGSFNISGIDRYRVFCRLPPRTSDRCVFLAPCTKSTARRGRGFLHRPGSVRPRARIPRHLSSCSSFWRSRCRKRNEWDSKIRCFVWIVLYNVCVNLFAQGAHSVIKWIHCSLRV